MFRSNDLTPWHYSRANPQLVNNWDRVAAGRQIFLSEVTNVFRGKCTQ